MNGSKLFLLALAASLLLSLCSCGPFGLLPILGGAAAGIDGGDDGKPPPPEMATNPYPTDWGSNMPVTVSLSWDWADRADYYDIYFGTDFMAVSNAGYGSPEYKGRIGDSWHDPPGILTFSTTYYWRVDPGNAGGVTRGDPWQFATESTPVTEPDLVQNPDPFDSATNVAIDYTLSWSAAARATSYDVYFGTDAVAIANADTMSSEFRGNQTALGFGPGLGYDTTYYWRIDSVNSVGTVEGDVWYFTTLSMGAPSADFTASPTSGDAPLWVNFTDMSAGSITSWSWNFGDGGTSGAQNPSYTYNNTGTYTVTLTVYGPGGWDEEIKTNFITVTGAGPVADFSATPRSGGAPLDVNFSDMSSGSVTSWVWDFGDGGTSFAQNPVHAYTSQGTYTVTLTVDGPGGSDQNIKTGYITVGDQVEDFETGDLSKFAWSTGGNGTWYVTSAESYTGTYSARPGTISHLENTYLEVTLTVQAGNITFYRKVSSEEFCDYLIFYIDGNQQDSWSGDTGWSQESFPVAAGTHTFRWEYDKDVSINSYQDTAWIDDIDFSSGGALPTADFTASPTSGDAPLFVSFTDLSTGTIISWSWDFGDTGTSTMQNPTHTYMNSGTYSVMLTVAGPGGPDSITKTSYITVTEPAPVADFTASPTAGIAPLDVNFTDASTGLVTSWWWDFGDTATGAGANPSHQYSTAGTYTVTLTATGPGGSDDEIKASYVTVTPPAGNTIYVDGISGLDTNDGLSWPMAVRTIQTGINKASDNWAVLVADGTYTGINNKNLDFGGKAITVKSDGGAANCIIDCQSSGRGFYFHSGETNSATVEGFTIQNGRLDPGSGAGICCENTSSPIIRDCVIKNCEAYYTSPTGGSGGGIYCRDSDPVIEGCTIEGNWAYWGGCGIYCFQADATVTNCTIINNIPTTQDGGGIRCWNNCTVTVTSCTISNNSADQGGAIAGQDCTLIISDCVMENNTATAYGGAFKGLRVGGSITDCTIKNNSGPMAGGGIYSDESPNPTISNCTITDNQANVGGGIAYEGGANMKVENCLIARNQALTADGGGFFAQIDAHAEIINCTVVGNSASRYGGGIYCRTVSTYACSATPINTVVWGNSAGTGNQLHADGAYSSITLNHCDYADGPGEVEGSGTVTPNNCINSDPRFRDAGNGDYRLKPGSPCFDNGDDSYVTWSEDLDGNARTMGRSVDIGTYELNVIRVPSNYFFIQDAIDAANTWDVVLVADGTYNESGLDFNGKTIGVRSENGPESTIIDCQYGDRGFYFHSGETNDAIAEGFTIIYGRASDDNGGAIYCKDWSSPTIRNFIIKNCDAVYSTGGGRGGGICCLNYSSPIISNCSIFNNNGHTYGGAICCWQYSSPAITNCLIYNNTSGIGTQGGGGIACYNYSDPTITNCTIVSNTTTGEGGGISCSSNSVATVNNSILWGNGGADGQQIYISADSTLFINYSDYLNTPSDVVTYGSFWPSSCINLTPEFLSWGDGDFRLKGISPCIDVGDNSLIPAGITTDLDGDLRIRNAIVDIGAYEHRAWIEKFPASSPSARLTHTMAYDSNRGVIVLFGGSEGVISLNDIWEWDGATWTEMFPATKPSTRYEHAMAYDSSRGVVVLFGGSDGSTNLGDTWEWDGTDWTQRFPITSPSARRFHAMAYDSNRGVVVLFGGYDSGRIDDTWEWDGTDWTQKFPTNKPSTRNEHAMAYDSNRGVVVLFGGYDSGRIDDTWEWDGIDWTQRFPLNSPSARVWHAMAYDSSRGITVLFGGHDGSFRDDTWEWDGTDWVEKFPANRPSMRYCPAMAYDSGRGVLTLFGGYDGGFYADTWEY